MLSGEAQLNQGVKLFRCLEREFEEEIDPDNLLILDTSSLDTQLREKAKSVLALPQEQHDKNT